MSSRGSRLAKRHNPWWIGRIVVGTAVLALATGAAWAAMEPWEQVLAQQLDLEQKCVLTGTYDVQEWPLGDELVLSGKARCYDGREFDFSQKKNHMKFEIRACEPTVC
jgi:hypothetical protein